MKASEHFGWWGISIAIASVAAASSAFADIVVV